MARSIWRTQVAELRKRLPRDNEGVEIAGFLVRYLDVGHPGKISGLLYQACSGHQHSLDGQSIDFEPPFGRDQVPAPWRELLDSECPSVVG
jgi:hypothetical protein